LILRYLIRRNKNKNR